MEVLKCLLKLKKLMFVICFSMVFVLTQFCYADTSSSTSLSEATKYTLDWPIILVGGVGVAGIVAAIILWKNDNSNDSNAPSPVNPTSVAHLLPVIYSLSNHNLLSINGVAATGTITVYNAGTGGPVKFSYDKNSDSLVVDSNSTCLTQTTAPGGICTFNISYTGDAATDSRNSVLFTVNGDVNDSIPISIISKPLNTFFAPAFLDTNAKGVYSSARAFATVQVNGVEFLYVVASTTTNQTGIYKSNDSGSSWIPVGVGLSLGAGEYLISLVSHEGSLYVGTTAGKIFKLDESTATFGIVGDAADVGQITVLHSQGGVLYAGGNSGNGVYSLSGTVWTQVGSAGWPGGSVLSFCTGSDGLLYVGTDGNGIYKLSSGTWTQVIPGDTSTVLSLCLHNGLLQAGLYSGAIYSIDVFGTSWTQVGGTIGSSGGIRSLRSHKGVLYAGTGSLGVYGFSGTSWVADNTGDLGNTVGRQINALHSISDSVLYAAVDGSGVYFTTNGGVSWTAANNDEAVTRVDYYFCSQGGYLYIGTSGAGVFRSNDGGANWTSFNTVIGDGAGLANKNITALHSGNDLDNGVSYLYAGTSTGSVYRINPLTDTSWTLASTPVSGYKISGFASEVGMLYISSGGGVRMSSDHGGSFANITDWGNARADKLVLFGNILYVASGGGVFPGVWQLADPKTSSANWVNTNISMTDANVYSLCIYNNHLYAGTYGGNVYKLDGTWARVGSGAAMSMPVWTLQSNGGFLYAGLRNDMGAIGGGVYRSTGSTVGSDGNWVEWDADIEPAGTAVVNNLYSNSEGYLYVGTNSGIYKGMMG